MNATCPRLASILIGCVALAPAAASSVLVVAPSGAPFTAIQAAVDAATDGDTIVVRPGTYPGFLVTAKSLSILADPEGSATVTTQIRFHDLMADQPISLTGFVCLRGVRATLIDGPLRLEALQSSSTGLDAWPAVSVELCDNVGIFRSTLVGSGSYGPYPDPPEPGIYAWESLVALHDSQVSGGQGSAAHYVGTGGSSHPALPGAAGCRMEGMSTLFAAGSSSLGGRGGAGLNGICVPSPSNGGPGADGGAGLLVGAGSQAWLLDVQSQGGPGGAGGAAGSCGTTPGADGAPGPATSGLATTLTGQRRALSCATHVREQNPLTLVLAGQPGDLVWIHASQQARWALDLPFSGVRLVGTGARRRFLGTLPGSGALAASVTFGDLGPGVQAQTWHFQGFFRDTSNRSFHGSGAVVVVLDSAF